MQYLSFCVWLIHSVLCPLMSQMSEFPSFFKAVKFHCIPIHIRIYHPFLSVDPLSLFPYIDYCENFCYAHEGADIAFISVFVSSGFDLSLYIKSYMDYMIVLIFRNLYRGFTNLHSHKTVHMGSLFFKFMSSLFYFISL